MAQSSAKEGNDRGLSSQKPVPPPMQSVIKGGWTYRVEDPIESCISALKELSQQIRTDFRFFVQHGPKGFSPSQTHARAQEIAALATEFEKLAAEVEKLAVEPQHPLPFQRVSEILHKLHKLGFYPNNLLFENAVRAFVSAEKFRRIDQLALREGEGLG